MMARAKLWDLLSMDASNTELCLTIFSRYFGPNGVNITSTTVTFTLTFNCQNLSSKNFCFEFQLQEVFSTGQNYIQILIKATLMKCFLLLYTHTLSLSKRLSQPSQYLSNITAWLNVRELSLPRISYSWNKRKPRGQVKTFHKEVLIIFIYHVQLQKHSKITVADFLYLNINSISIIYRLNYISSI